MKKTYVLDTNVILHNPHSILSFEDNEVIIPDVVIDELDKHKNAPGEIGANARAASRILQKMIKDSDRGNLLNGYNMENGGSIRIEMNCVNTPMPETWVSNNDLRILRVCKGLQEKGSNIVLVSNDTFVRIKAEVLKIKAEEFTTERAPVSEEQYSGRRVGWVSKSKMDKLYTNGLNPKNIKYYNENGEDIELSPLTLNEYILIKCSDNKSGSALAFYDGNKVVALEQIYERAGNITPNNVGQKFALHAMKSKEPLTIIKGPAGTGKTLLAVAVGLEAVEQKQFEGILYLRSNIKLDEDIGFLPGSEEEKLEWAVRPVKDALKVIFKTKEKENFSSASKTRKGKTRYNSKYDEEFDDKAFITSETALKDKITEIFSREIIKIEAVGHMRGRSLPNTLVIIDEAQNLTPKQIRTLLTRCSKSSKIILMGDIEQIDHPYLDARTNGLSVASDKMQGSFTTNQMTFLPEECERSELSKEVSDRMGDK